MPPTWSFGAISSESHAAAAGPPSLGAQVRRAEAGTRLMNNFYLILGVEVGVLSALAALMVRRSRRARAIEQNLLQRHATWLGSGTTFRVALLPSAEIEHHPEASLANPQTGILVIGLDTVRFAGIAPLSGRDVLVDLRPDTRIALFRAPWNCVGPLRTLVRLSTPSASRYAYVLAGSRRPDDRATLVLDQALSLHFAREAEPLPERPTLTAGAAIAKLLAVLLVTTAIAVLVYLHRPDTGPLTLAAHPTLGVLGATQRAILSFDENGTLVRHESPSALGLPHAPRQLAFAPDGTLYAADSVDATLYRCAPGEPRKCSALAHQPLAADGAARRAVSFALDPTGTRIAVSVAGEYRLLLLDQDGAVLDRMDRDRSDLCYPNGMTFGADRHLYVADTNKFRVAEFAIDHDRLERVAAHAVVRAARPGSECGPAVASAPKFCGWALPLPGARDAYLWPLAVVQDQSRHWWVALADASLQHADLVEFDADWAPARMHRLGSGAGPGTLASTNEALWVADAELPGIHAVRGGAADEVSDPAFADLMGKLTAAARRFALLRVLVPLVLLALALALLGAALAGNRRRLAAILRNEPIRDAQ